MASTVAVRVWLRGGQLNEVVPGLALATGRLLTEGTRTRSWDEIVRTSEQLGMDVAGFGGPECIGVSIDALAADWRQAVELAADLVLDPIFPSDRCQWVRRQTEAELESLAEQPEVRTAWVFLQQLYGAHPWSRPLHGSRDGLAAVAPETCGAFHRSALARGVIVSIAGNIDEDEASTLATGLFSGVDGRLGGESDVGFSAPPAPRQSRREVRLPDADQAQVLVGHLTVPLAHPDFVALELASVILGSGPGLVGRIPERVREREGLAYAASAAMASGAGSEPGRLVVHAGTAPDRVDDLLLTVRQELELLVSEGLRDGEFEEARQYILGSDPFRRETARQIASLGAQSALHGVPLDQTAWLEESLQSLDRPAVEAAIRRHLDPAALSVTVGVPAVARGDGLNPRHPIV